MVDPEKYDDVEKDVECWLESDRIFSLAEQSCPEIKEPDSEQLEWLYYGN